MNLFENLITCQKFNFISKMNTSEIDRISSTGFDTLVTFKTFLSMIPFSTFSKHFVITDCLETDNGLHEFTIEVNHQNVMKLQNYLWKVDPNSQIEIYR